MSSLKIVKAYEGYKPYIAMLLVQVIYAGMALLSKASISSGMNPSIFVVYRQAFATISLAPVAYFFESPKTISQWPQVVCVYAILREFVSGHKLFATGFETGVDGFFNSFPTSHNQKNVSQLSYILIWKIFFSSLIGITICLNMYYHALNHTSATFAAATTNLIPAITFVIALILRIERMYIRELHGWVKLIGAITSLSGALVFAFVKGPTLNFMDWYTSGDGGEIASTTNQFSSKSEFIKGPLTILCANILWSCWSIMQAPIMKEFPAKLSLITLQCFFSLIQAIVGAVAMERNLSSWKLGWDFNLLSMAYCGVIVTAFTYWLQLWAIEKRGPVFTAMFTPLALIITAIVSLFLWKETLYFGSVCGAVLLAGGLYCVLWGKSREVESKISEEKSEQQEETTLESIKTQE